ncbi:hypothetical protein PybrP1_001928 [[Pythium] brassicae (nom. inval.)]|nr:hypothetical protein PybrP1_001928 [[Pythium] brassicae (nom. inval.)]
MRGPTTKVQPMPRGLAHTERLRFPFEARESFHYQLQVAHPLPVINLRFTPASHLLSRTANLQLLQWLKRNHVCVCYLQRASYLLNVVVIGAPREVAVALAVPSALCLLLPVCCTISMLSTDVLALLVRRYEFWFFTAMNVIVWSLMAYFLGDLRAVSVLPAFLVVELAIALDADFRTFVTATKNALYLEIPALIALGAAVYLHLLDVETLRLESRPYAKIGVTLLDIFLSTLATVVVFAVRLVYNRRSLLRRRNAGCKIVQCVLFRSNLVLCASGASTPSRAGGGARGSHGLLKRLGVMSAKIFFSRLHHSRQVHHLQQVTLVPPRLTAIDVRRTVLLSWPVCDATLAPAKVGLLYVVGFLGLVLSTISVGLTPPDDACASVSSARHIPVAALVFTVAFCGVCTCGYQRDLLVSLLKSFSFLFPSVHFVCACVCLADMIQWDYRCWAIVAACLWFHWVLLLDTLTPPVKQRLGFRKRLAAPVLLSLWLSMAAASYAVVLVDRSASKLLDRDLFEWHIGGQTVAWNTKSVLLGRVATLFVWTTRLFYDVAFRRGDDLLFIRGALDYYCPYDTFPGAQSASGSRRVAVFPVFAANRKGRRRSSYADSLLLSQSSIRRSSGAACVLLGRTQSPLPTRHLPPKKPVPSLAPLAKAASATKLTDDILRTDCDNAGGPGRLPRRHSSSLTMIPTRSNRCDTTVAVW